MAILGLKIFLHHTRTFFFLAFMVLTLSTVAQTREELERQRKQIQQEIEALQHAQNAIKKDKKASLSQLNLVQSKLQKRNAVIDNINTQVKLIDNNIYNNNREIYRLQKQIDTLTNHYGKTIEYAYKNRSSYDMLNFIFSSTSFNDAIRRISYLKSYRNYRDEQVANINKTKDLLENRIVTLSNNKKEKSQVLVEQSKQLKVLEEEKKEKSVVVSRIKEREKEINKELDAKKRVNRNIQNAISAAIKREIDAARKRAADDARKAAAAANNTAASRPTSKPESGSSSKLAAVRKENVLESTPEVTRVSIGFENNKRNLPWPVDKASVTTPYGKRKIEGTTLVEDNIGITIATNVGSSVKAVFEGVVTTIADISGSTTIIIKHGKYFTTYQNLTGVTVSKGAEVKMGQVIGRAGTNFDEDGGEIIFVVSKAVTTSSVNENPETWLKPKN